MKKHCGFYFFLLLFLTITNLSIKAEGVRYITDELRVNLRAGPGTDYKILQTLKSRYKVTLLEVEGSWSRIDFQGSTGWVPNQYLIFTSTALIDPNQAGANLTDKIDFQNSQDIIQIQQQAIERLGDENRKLLVQKNKLEQQLNSLNKLNESSEKMQREREELLGRIVEAENRNQLLENVYASSQDSTAKNLIFISIASSIFAFILGFMATYIKRRKRNRNY